MRRLVASVCAVSVIGCGASRPRPMALRRVILYQNGIGYFERSGQLVGGSLKLTFARPELDDVLKTLTVIDKLGASGVATVDVPTPGAKDRTIGIDVRLASRRTHDLLVGYAVPTPTWKAAYRVVLDDRPGALLQGWAMINNTSQEDWERVQLTLATGAPMSFAHDLHTPTYVKRPDATGHLVAPTVLGPVDPETSGYRDRDGDAIADATDRCPDSPEDLDGFSDVDGCPDVDRDGDRIADIADRCPNEPESYNGAEDDDGCPDRGRVILSSTSIEILEAITFARDSDELTPAGRQILDAVAATLKGNPDIARIEVGGHASADETDVWGLAARRAEVVRAALVARGVAPARLEATGYAATAPRDAGSTQAGLAKNRRTEFLILKRGSEAPATAPGYVRIDTQTAAASTRTTTKAAAVAGTVRYAVGEPVTVKRGRSTMVSILNQPIEGEDALLYRPDGNAPGSDRHPFRAVRLHNGSGFTLEPGPIAIFSGGSFVGDSLLGRLDLGQTAWIPYALDGGTRVAVARADAEQPIRLVTLSKGVMTVENAGVKTTTYTIAAGKDLPRTIYLRHGKSAGYTASDLPPKTQDQGDAYLVPVPLASGKTATLAIEEREARRRSVAILDAGATELSVYLSGARLPKELADKVTEAIALRKDLGTIEDRIRALRTKLADTTERSSELRENLGSLEKVRGADDLKKRLVANLTSAVADSDAIARQLGLEMERLQTARQRLSLALRDLTLEAS